MPVEKRTTAHDAQIIDCLNDYLAYAKSLGSMPPTVQFDARTFEQSIADGIKWWAYVPAGRGGRVDGCVGYKHEQRPGPGGRMPGVWAETKWLATRASVLPTTAEKVRTMFLAVRGMIPEAIEEVPDCRGLTGIFQVEHVDLHQYISDAFAGIVEWQSNGRAHRFWLPRGPFVTQFGLKAREYGTDKEPIVTASLADIKQIHGHIQR